MFQVHACCFAWASASWNEKQTKHKFKYHKTDIHVHFGYTILAQIIKNIQKQKQMVPREDCLKILNRKTIK